MFFRPKKQLYRLPRYKTLRLKRGNGRRRVSVIIGRGLQAVECAQGAVYEGYRGRGCFNEEDIIIATHGTVESSELGRREI